MYVNLLPQKTRVKIQFRRMLRGYLIAWGLGGLVVAVYAVVQAGQFWQASRELALLEKRCQPVYALQRAIVRDQRQLKLLQSHLEKLHALQPSNHVMDLLGVLVEATRAELGRLHIQRLSLLSGQMPVATPGTSASNNKTKSQPTISTLSLSGIAEDDATVTRFVSSLRAAGVFDQVDLKASSQVGGDDGGRQYQLECRYQDAP